MNPSTPKNFLILGGGTAGWMSAAILARALFAGRHSQQTITLVESVEMGTVGVGEATIPAILDFIRFLGLREEEFMEKTNATYKLAIKFRDWNSIGKDYWHPFGTLGPNLENRPLFQHWLRAQQNGISPPPLMSLSIAAQMAESGVFKKPSEDPSSSLNGLGYALHFDAGAVAKVLREYSEAKGVKRVEGKVVEVTKKINGDLEGLILSDGRTLSGDFFIDCSGFSGLLIEKSLGSGFEDWSHWLPCDRAIAAPCENDQKLLPYTISSAKTAGWAWKIPLRSRVGNGYVYSSGFESEAVASQTLMASLPSSPTAEPRQLSFKAGRRSEPWKRNCLAIGLASGFLEPLESTSIHLIFANLFRFLEYFPDGKNDDYLRRTLNEKSSREIEEIRDFIILHYCTTSRRDTEFWRYVSSMKIPISLEERISLFTKNGRIVSDYYELFKPVSWISVLNGMGVVPSGYDPLVDAVAPHISVKVMQTVIDNINNVVRNAAPLTCYPKIEAI